MEIDTAPRPPASTPWGRLVLSVVFFAPVTLFVLLPIGLGFDRHVVTGDSMAGDQSGGMGHGALAFERVVPVSDLRVGDVITYPRPDGDDSDAPVTHRIVAIEHGGITTKGDADEDPDPWTLRPDGPTLPRVVFTVPWIGWASLSLSHPSGWLVIVVAAGVLAVPAVRRVRRRTPSRVARPGQAGAPPPDDEVPATVVRSLKSE